MQNKLHHNYISKYNIIVMLLLKFYSFFFAVAFFVVVFLVVFFFAVVFLVVVFVVLRALFVVVLPYSFTSSGVQTSPFLGLFQDI